MKNMKIKCLVPLFLGVIILSILPKGFVDLPAYVSMFDKLTPDGINVLRYITKGTAFGVIYGIYNTITHRIYVGSTINPVVRFYEHTISGLNSNTHLQNAISKYGLKSFVVIIFELVANSATITKQDLLNVEQKYLDHFPRGQKYNFASKTSGGGQPIDILGRQSVSERMTGVNIGPACCSY